MALLDAPHGLRTHAELGRSGVDDRPGCVTEIAVDAALAAPAGSARRAIGPNNV